MNTSKYLLVFPLLALFFLFTTPRADVINFDDITTELLWIGTYQYADLSVDIEHLISNEFYTTSNECLNTITFPSQEYVLSNYCGGGDVTFTSQSDFDFNGASVSTWAYQNAPGLYGAQTLTVTGYNNGIEVGSTTFGLSADFDYEDINLLGVDEVVFTPNDGNTSGWFLLDDFTFNETASVPEPTSMTLLGISFVCLFFIRRKNES